MRTLKPGQRVKFKEASLGGMGGCCCAYLRNLSMFCQHLYPFIPLSQGNNCSQAQRLSLDSTNGSFWDLGTKDWMKHVGGGGWQDRQLKPPRRFGTDSGYNIISVLFDG